MKSTHSTYLALSSPLLSARKNNQSLIFGHILLQGEITELRWSTFLVASCPLLFKTYQVLTFSEPPIIGSVKLAKKCPSCYMLGKESNNRLCKTSQVSVSSTGRFRVGGSRPTTYSPAQLSPKNLDLKVLGCLH